MKEKEHVSAEAHLRGNAGSLGLPGTLLQKEGDRERGQKKVQSAKKKKGYPGQAVY